MRTLYESLLDIDDLENNSDKTIKSINSIGDKMMCYKITTCGMKVGDVFSLRKLKKLNIPIIQDKFTIESTRSRKSVLVQSTKRPKPVELLLVNYILDMPNDDIYNNPHTGYISETQIHRKLQEVMNENYKVHIYRSTNISHDYVMFDIDIYNEESGYRKYLKLNFIQK